MLKKKKKIRVIKRSIKLQNSMHENILVQKNINVINT